jgi:hypothetical protein
MAGVVRRHRTLRVRTTGRSKGATQAAQHPMGYESERDDSVSRAGETPMAHCGLPVCQVPAAMRVRRPNSSAIRSDTASTAFASGAYTTFQPLAKASHVK